MTFIFFHWSLYRFLSFLFQQNPPQRHIQHPPPSFHQWLPTNNWINFLQIVQQLLPTFPSPSINCVQHLPPSFSPNHSFIPHNFPFPQWSSSDLPSNYYYYYYYPILLLLLSNIYFQLCLLFAALRPHPSILDSNIISNTNCIQFRAILPIQLSADRPPLVFVRLINV